MSKEYSRSKKLFLNSGSSLVFQITTVICGFILPRIILNTYGSEVNGLVNSITQFLSIIGFLEFGVGAVIQSSLYKPIAENDFVEISKIVHSGQKFFRKIATILVVYVAVLVVFYPFLVNQSFGWVYTATMIVALSVSSFAQYYFGVVDRLFLTANQRGYIQYNTQTITLIINTIACCILIKYGASIHMVKLTTSIIYLFRPLVLRLYVNKHYQIDRKIEYTGEPIKQKWNGLAQHVSAVVLDGTDNIVLTIFSTLSNVSIYSVYHMVVYNVKNLFTSSTQGVHALLGELWAKKETKKLTEFFSLFEWALHTATVFIFCCCGVLIIPFVEVYTSGVTDVNYIQPAFAYIITAANACHCLRIPYNSMILATGHYKQTQKNYIISASINIVISVVAVINFGLVGVAIGTLVAMLYQTVWMAWYVSKNLLERPLHIFIKHILVDVVCVACSFFAVSWIEMSSVSYLSWIIMAVEVAVICFAVIAVLNIILYRKICCDGLRLVKDRLKRNK
ncbi:MAG: oligosaccharide flippase family protein [Oscillospiraceae bacterium]|nr:oligosaccharide flippase family protein [Oscillospiraceae bacterium]